MAGKWKTVGSIRRGKSGGLYIKVDEDVTLKKGGALQLQDPRQNNVNLAEKGYITSEEAEERNAKIPDYIRYNVVLAPEK